ncbi:MAG: ribosome maturation factor RimP [Acidobacteriota bacterium]
MAQAVEPQLNALIERIVTAEGFEFVHCEFFGGRKQAVLRIYIDKPGGVTLQDCSYISNQVGMVLDVEDLIPHQYVLEVSSPGVNRGLYKRSDYERFAGHLIRLKTHQAIDGRRNFHGRLEGLEGEQVKLLDQQGKILLIPFQEIATANLEVDLDELFRRAKQQP